MLMFSYQIVPKDDQAVVVRGTLYISDVEAAKRYVQTVACRDLPADTELEVILQDHIGSPIWRGPYLGKGGEALKALAARNAPP